MSHPSEHRGPPGPPLGRLLEECFPEGSLLDRSESRALELVLDTPAEALRAAGLTAWQRNEPGRSRLLVEPVSLVPAIRRDGLPLHAELVDGRNVGDVLHERLQGWLDAPVAEGLSCVVSQELRHERARLRRDDLEVELALDHIEARRPDAAGRHAFTELRALHVGGSPTTFASTVQQLARALSAEPATEARYPYLRQQLGLPPFYVDEPEPSIDPRARVGVVARMVGRSLLWRMRQHEAGTRVGLDPEQLHKMRVATRRLRSALRVLGEAFATPTRRVLRAELRWLAQVLGRVRDLDVQRLALPGWRATHAGLPLGERGWDEVEQALAKRWDRAQRELVEVLGSERYRRLLAIAEAAFGSDETTKVGRRRLARVLPELLRQPMRRFAKAHDRFRRTGVMDDAHRLRIEAKGLRYAFELFGSLWGRGAQRRLRRLVAFQDALGEQQDAVVARGMVEQLLGEAEDRPAYAFVLGQLHGASTEVIARGPTVVREALEGLRADDVLARLERAARRVARA